MTTLPTAPKNPYSNKDYQKGKTMKEIEYGIQWPDGTVEWGVWMPNMNSARIDTPEGREEFLKDYEARTKGLHMPTVGKILFLQRTVTTKYGEPGIAQV